MNRAQREREEQVQELEREVHRMWRERLDDELSADGIELDETDD